MAKLYYSKTSLPTLVYFKICGFKHTKKHTCKKNRKVLLFEISSNLLYGIKVHIQSKATLA